MICAGLPPTSVWLLRQTENRLQGLSDTFVFCEALKPKVDIRGWHQWSSSAELWCDWRNREGPSIILSWWATRFHLDQPQTNNVKDVKGFPVRLYLSGVCFLMGRIHGRAQQFFLFFWWLQLNSFLLLLQTRCTWWWWKWKLEWWWWWWCWHSSIWFCSG